MVYESDFYTTRRPYSRPLASSYSVTTPRHYVVRDYPEVGVRSAQEQYSYAYTNTSSSSSTSDPYSRRPQRTSYTEENVTKRESGPYGSYSTERSTRSSSGGGPGSYRSSYESHSSGRLPGGTTYRHYSYRDRPITVPLSSIIQLRSIPHMPYVAHKRLVTIVHSPVHNVYYAGLELPIRVHARVRPSILAAELNRIRTMIRPSTTSYTEKYLNSKDHIVSLLRPTSYLFKQYFDDEAREIRARVDSLLRRVHVFVPRAVASDFAEEIVPERMRSGDYVRRLILGKNNAKKDMEPVSWYEVPDRSNFGNLSCVKYVAGKPQSVRKPYFKVADLRPSDIKNDVNFLSYYSKNRQAAANACKGWRDRVPELYEDPTKPKKNEDEDLAESAEE